MVTAAPRQPTGLPKKGEHKYCRQLGKRAHEIDALLAESGYTGFRELLAKKYSPHQPIIEMYFDSMMSDSDDADFLTSESS